MTLESDAALNDSTADGAIGQGTGGPSPASQMALRPSPQLKTGRRLAGSPRGSSALNRSYTLTRTSCGRDSMSMPSGSGTVVKPAAQARSLALSGRHPDIMVVPTVHLSWPTPYLWPVGAGNPIRRHTAGLSSD